MAKRNKAKSYAKARKSALRVEALEQRQLLAVVAGSGDSPDSYQNIIHPNGNVFDQVLMTGSSVTVDADWGLNQITRVSYLDLSGDIVQAEFSGKGTLTISLDQYSAPAEAAGYNQPGVKYVGGHATFTIQGTDANTNFSVFSVGSGNAVNQDLFAGGKTGGNNLADVQALRIVADPQNPGGFSTFGGVRAGNAVFSGDSGTVGIAAAAVNVQGPVIVGDINSSNAGVPTLNFASASQFSTLTLAGGDLMNANGAGGWVSGGFTTINSTAGQNSAGVDLGASVPNAASVAKIGVTASTLDSATAIDITGKTQAQIDALFLGHTFSNAVTVTGDLAVNQAINATAFSGGVTFTGELDGTVTTTAEVASFTAAKNLDAALAVGTTLGAVSVTGNVSAQISATSIGDVTIGGNLTALVTTDTDANNAWTAGEGAVGNVNVTGDISGGGWIEGVLGIGNVSVGDDITAANAGGILVTRAGLSGAFANIGTLTVEGDIDQGVTTSPVVNITGNGTFGNVIVKGTGSADATAEVGSFTVAGSLGTAATSTGTISLTNTNISGDISWGGLSVAASAAGSIGGITVTGGGNAGNFVLAAPITGGALTVGDISVTNFLTITNDAAGTIQAEGAAITFATVGDNNAAVADIAVNGVIGTTVSNTGAISMSGTGDDTDIIIGAQVGSLATNIASLTLNAGTGGTTNVSLTAAILAEDFLGNISVTADTVTLTNAAAQIRADDDAADITFTGNTTMTGPNKLLIDDDMGTLTVTGNLTLNADGTGTVLNITDAAAGINITGTTTIGTADATPTLHVNAVSGSVTFGNDLVLNNANDIDIASVAGALTITDATFSNGSQILVRGSLGSLVFNGLTTLTANASTSIDLDDSTSALDTIGSVAINGLFLGSATVGVDDIRASAIGDVTISTALTQDQVLVTDLSILAAPNGNATVSLAETISQDGSNIQSYAIGNISVSSTLALAFTGTKLFSGDNSFVAQGKIGDISVTGAVAGAQQSSLFTAATDAAWFAAGDTDGLLTTTFANEANVVIYDAANDGTTEDNSAAPNWTGGTVAIGSVTVNANQTIDNALPQNSGVDLIGGTDADAGGTLEGFAVLSGVRVAAADGDLIALGALGASAVNAVDIDANLAGTIGNILISSNQAVGFLDEVTLATLVGTAGDQVSAILAATSTGTAQAATSTAAIIGDTNATAENTVENASASGQIVVLVV